ncbi:hypothetical protein EYF80_008636 [Liparis tanakae]|uniref:Uncharacterized protein n=1 Tax=Liparis tanakae TaxID=230148 RepID=A0A4Z2ISK6_9TELE|nr:hypothetical protein EYF80_008636 [Liparis tanakae]
MLGRVLCWPASFFSWVLAVVIFRLNIGSSLVPSHSVLMICPTLRSTIGLLGYAVMYSSMKSRHDASSMSSQLATIRSACIVPGVTEKGGGLSALCGIARDESPAYAGCPADYGHQQEEAEQGKEEEGKTKIHVHIHPGHGDDWRADERGQDEGRN